MHKITADWLSLTDIEKIIEDGTLLLSEASKKKIYSSRKAVEKIIKSGRVVYGLNTGFGKFSETKISNDSIIELQKRIVLSHSAGVGKPIPPHIVLLILFLKLQALSYGYSGCTLEVVEQLLSFFNMKIIPVIPSKGSVGASGDLAPLAHLAGTLIGKGFCWSEGVKSPTEEILKKKGLLPIKLQAKDGLAILNGTQVMGAYLIDSLLCLDAYLRQAELIAGLTFEALCGTKKAFDKRIHMIRNQQGQQKVAERMRYLFEGSELVDSKNQVQDIYSLRCIPQVHGAVLDTYNYVHSIAERELNGVTDNPLIFSKNLDVLSGGNFHGEPLAMAADFMTIGVAELASISERRIAALMDENISELPPFLVKNGGLNSGFMIAQYTAAALVSENKVLSHPASVDSIPTSGNKEDHVSMGTHATRKLSEVVENMLTVYSIELLCAAQAVEFHLPKKPSPKLEKIYQLVRDTIPTWNCDRLMNVDIEKAMQLIRGRELIQAIGAH